MTTQTQAPETTAVAEVKKDISVKVLSKISAFQSSGELRLPNDYSPENALKSAFIVLSDPKNNLIAKCSNSSVAEALLKMVIYGVSPLKKQCYFIPYGDKLDCSISYMGNIAIAKRYGNLKSIKANAIFEGDTFEFHVDENTGRRKVIKHIQTLDSVGSKNLKGAYAVFELNDGTTDVEVMNIAQIQAAWKQGATKGVSPAHNNFPDQMAQRTVINRACKLLINSSDDAILYDDVHDNTIDVAAENHNFEIQNEANKEPIEFADHEELVNDNPEQVKVEQPEPASADLSNGQDDKGPGY